MASGTCALILNNPTHLFVGPATAVTNAVIATVQAMLCVQGGCGYCARCQGVYTRSSAQLLWLEPEALYTREIIEPIFETLGLQRAQHDYFFIVLAKAERLQQSTANALLKSLEEPPSGYYFLLMTSHEKQVLPTIRSRAIVHTIEGTDDRALHENPLFAHFTGTSILGAAQFLQTLDQLDLSDQESAELLDLILLHMYRVVKHAPVEHEKIAVLMQAATTPPQSGSSKIFWKNLYLQTL